MARCNHTLLGAQCERNDAHENDAHEVHFATVDGYPLHWHDVHSDLPVGPIEGDNSVN